MRKAAPKPYDYSYPLTITCAHCKLAIKYYPPASGMGAVVCRRCGMVNTISQGSELTRAQALGCWAAAIAFIIVVALILATMDQG
ncbi:hypothetical protein [Streptomyces atratus]